MQDSPKHCTRPKVLHTHTNKQTCVQSLAQTGKPPLRTQCVGESVKCCTTHCWIVAFGDCPLSSETWCGWAFRGLVDGYPPPGPELPHPLRDITKVGRDEKWAWREKKHILHILNNHIFIIPHSSISLTAFTPNNPSRLSLFVFWSISAERMSPCFHGGETEQWSLRVLGWSGFTLATMCSVTSDS